jgi:hypothetical protein
VFFRENVQRRPFFHNEVNEISNQVLLNQGIVQFSDLDRVNDQPFKKLKIPINPQPVLRRIMVQHSEVLVNEFTNLIPIILTTLFPSLY